MIDYSIIISTYNQKHTLALALESLRSQIKNPKTVEIVVSDDCSTDGTSEFIRRLRYPIFLKYSCSERNLGRGHNRNRGLDKAAGKMLIFIDGDMVPCPGFIETYLKAWNEFPGNACLGSFRHPPDMKGGRLFEYLYSRGRLILPHGAPVAGRFFTSGNFSIPKDIAMSLKGFDTSFGGWGGEDTDFGLRLEKIDVNLRAIPEAWCYHYHDKSVEQMASEFELFGLNGYPLLANKYPNDLVYEKGWLVGLPDKNAGFFKKILATILMPLRTKPVLTVLKNFIQSDKGMRKTDLHYDWLFYGHLARGYRKFKR